MMDGERERTGREAVPVMEWNERQDQQLVPSHFSSSMNRLSLGPPLTG